MCLLSTLQPSYSPNDSNLLSWFRKHDVSCLVSYRRFPTINSTVYSCDFLSIGTEKPKYGDASRTISNSHESSINFSQYQKTIHALIKWNLLICIESLKPPFLFTRLIYSPSLVFSFLYKVGEISDFLPIPVSALFFLRHGIQKHIVS